MENTLHTKYRIAAILAATLLPATSIAQNTPDDWKWLNTHYENYGEWTTACEDRADDEAIKRCYLRYVDVYSTEPFGAFFVFITETNDGPRFAISKERSADFTAHWRAVKGGQDIWEYDPAKCPFFGECIITGKQATDLRDALVSGGDLTFDFNETGGRKYNQVWSGEPFAAAYEDLVKQTNMRGLLDG